jgi:predicted dehydrogenase
MMDTLIRLAFLRSSLGVAGTVALWPSARALGANDKIVMGVMGLGGRGTYLAEKFAERPDVEVAYLCDPNTRRFARAREAVEEAQDRSPKMVQDFRRMLDDKSVDVLINATPDHWHAMASILACQAGKDVFVEKPLAHNIWEGRKMVEAARKYQRVIQVGMQSRSAPYAHKARDYIRAGKLGEVYLVRVYNMMQHPKQREAPDGPVPDGFDYELWCGPAPKRPYNPSRQWLNQFDYSCGPIAGDAVHQFDLARFLVGDPLYPSAVSQTGAIRSLRDGRDMPDTQMALFEYDGLTMTLDASLWTPYMKKIPASIRFRPVPRLAVLQHEGRGPGHARVHGLRPARRRLAGLRRQQRAGPLGIRPPRRQGAPGQLHRLHPQPEEADVRRRDRTPLRAAVPHRQYLVPRRQSAYAIRSGDGIVHELRRGQPVSQAPVPPRLGHPGERMTRVERPAPEKMAGPRRCHSERSRGIWR